MQKAIELSLKTWYPRDHKLHLDPLHPAIKLAGEAGELLDLYGKHRYKPGFDWWDCKHCGNVGIAHDSPDDECGEYVPLVLDELGDWWYYYRIICYITNIDYSEERPVTGTSDILVSLFWLNRYSLSVLAGYMLHKSVEKLDLGLSYLHLLNILEILECSLGDLTELNYAKLNSDPTHHGWKDAK